jgi:hypothetical protein
MNSNNLQEAYLEVYQLDELTGGKGHPGYKAGSKDHGPMQSGHPADSEKRKDKGGTMSMRHGYHLDDIDDDDDEDEYESIVKQQSRDSRERVRKSLRNKVKAARKVLSKEQVDIYDIILSHLLDEAVKGESSERRKDLAAQRRAGYKPLPPSRGRENVAKMKRDIEYFDKKDTNEDFEINESEGSYGQTPTARKSYGDLSNKRRETPASEYSERGEKTKKVKSAQKHFDRTGNPDAGNRGKKSSRPYYPGGRKGMTQKDRDWSRGADEYGHSGYDGEGGGGSLPKGKKLERQRKTGVSAESFDLYDVILSHLLDEGYVSTEEAADKIILNMSESWFEDIMELNRYAKETGKSLKTGRASAKGGNEQIKKRVEKEPYLKYGGSKEKPKVRGEKPPVAGEPGSERQSPSHMVALRRARTERLKNQPIGSRFD